ncbi:MAG: hypothetical protein F4047_18275 [Caldilineaceae bacterium SB0670_bin_27]|uniref:Uncharacterized protein n=1 Tax=Caldilineaceae bacterium SB0664_bin_27 TaxID=2605260 RepID=A0A6B0YRG3_9CHLR|nr:hypothetical protein [Caldilineaceae bacterium SB0664_bin_27]MYJ80034.1 hypothetical protein [Caldilineaceae bacterium SB0670_bin_27]
MDIVYPSRETALQQFHLGLYDATKVVSRAPVIPANMKRLEETSTVGHYRIKVVSKLDYSLSGFTEIFLDRKNILPLRVFRLPTPSVAEPREHSVILSKEQSIFDNLSKGGRFDVYQHLFDIIESVSEDPDEEELIPESLESIAKFFLTTMLPLGSISIHEGTLTASWRLPHTMPPSDGWNNSDGFLFLRFLPSGLINCVMETRPTSDHEGIYFVSEIELTQVAEKTLPFFTRHNQ